MIIYHCSSLTQLLTFPNHALIRIRGGFQGKKKGTETYGCGSKRYRKDWEYDTVIFAVWIGCISLGWFDPSQHAIELIPLNVQSSIFTSHSSTAILSFISIKLKPFFLAKVQGVSPEHPLLTSHLCTGAPQGWWPWFMGEMLAEDVGSGFTLG